MPNGIDLVSVVIGVALGISATAFYLLRIQRMLFPNRMKMAGYWKWRNEAKVMVYWAEIRVPRGMTARNFTVSLSFKGASIPSGIGFPSFTLQSTNVNTSTQLYLFDTFQEDLVFLPEPNGTRHDYLLDEVRNDTLQITVRSDSIRGVDASVTVASIEKRARPFSPTK